MIAASATGELLPPYVVYKAQNLYDTWTENGPPGTRYNRSASGWFDANIFEDWIKSIALPYFRGFRKTGIWPINENQVLGRLPEENNNENKEDAVEKSVLDILKEMRYCTMNVTESKRKRKLDIIPGRRVGTETEEYVDTDEDNFENTRKIKTAETTTITCIKTKKGKGRGKKTKKPDQDINGTEEDKIIEVADTETIPKIEVANTKTIHRIEVANTETIPRIEVANTETIHRSCKYRNDARNV
ncbi:unnamed protein product [Parnassius apollo]|uniref:(apollo) hypothetical protein n=1 Tax=Parnassius apollo TaxID=110799 RepID=A0A8S3Y020_PARAO|nr:unnamed protein product [Parnassius apollo]